MASDFGDEAGQELYDWMLRIGQDAGGKAMSDAAGKLVQAAVYDIESRGKKVEATCSYAAHWLEKHGKN